MEIWCLWPVDLLRALHSLHDAALDELTDNEWLVELGSHKLGNTTLVHLQLRTYDDYRTSGIIDTLTEKVLTETALLTLEAIGKRLQRTVDIALQGRCLTAIVKK